MKLRLMVVLFIVILFFLPQMGDTAENNNPGRSVKLTEVIRITDYDEDFVFKRIRGIKIADDGSVFVRGIIQLLKFSADGKFIHNFSKRGEGPGEIKYLSNFILSGNDIIMGSIMPVKIIRFSQEGALQKELTVQKLPRFATILRLFRNNIYFVSGELLISGQKTGVIRRPNQISYVTPAGKVTHTGLTFDTRDLMMKKTGKEGIMISMDELTRFLSAFSGKYSYISHKERYHIVQVDLGSGKITKEFTRKYQRADYVKKVYTKKEDIELYKLYDREYYNDIYKLAVYKNNLQVFTSTMNKKGEILIDVFNDKGEYIDNFYLKIPGVKRPDDLVRKPVLFHHGYMWTTDTDEDDVPYVVKMKIENL